MLSAFRQRLGLYVQFRAREREDLIAWQQRYKEVFGTESGALVLADICKRNYVFDSTYAVVGGSNLTELHEGQRRAALSILRFVDRDTKDLIQNDENTPNP